MIFFVILQYNFEAIHNKDYSVVKTFKAATKTCRFFYFYLKPLKNPQSKQSEIIFHGVFWVQSS